MISKLFHFLRFGSFAHDLVRDRNAQGHLLERCTGCGYARVVLGSAVKTDGTAHVQQVDLGANRTKAKRIVRDNVAEFPERVSQR